MNISRRDLLGALPAIALLPRALTAQTGAQLHVRGLHSMTLAVTDVKRSLEFYQGLFGMPIQARHGDTPLLRVGPGPKFMALAPASAGGATGVSRFGIATEDFNDDRILAVLAEHGVTRAAGSSPAAAGPL
jgi:catechol 2,3-dioxygenase-like lactoylglutathione lyase family enzyme